MNAAWPNARGLWLCVALSIGAAAAWGQDAPPAKPETTPAKTDTPAAQPAAQPADETKPADGAEPLQVKVIEVKGDVSHTQPEPLNWQPCKADDVYTEGTLIRTGARSSIKLQIGSEEPYTAMIVESVGKIAIGEAYKSKDLKKVRVGVAYGKIRAGVAEGGLKSDFTVDSPVATLSKKGTWNFGMSCFEDRFEVFLLDYGLVDALKKVSGETRRLQPREYVTEAMRKWFDEAQHGRTVPFVDLLGQSDLDVAFNRMRQDGLRVLDPEGGQSVLIDLSNQQAQQSFLNLVRNIPTTPVSPISPVGARLRAEGFFGTGRGDQLVPVIIEANSPLAQKGFAKPGRYMFNREALHNWTKSVGK